MYLGIILFFVGPAAAFVWNVVGYKLHASQLFPSMQDKAHCTIGGK